MKTLARTLPRASHYDYLPVPDLLAPLGLKIRRGQMVMVAGHPGAGKSSVVLWWVLAMGLKTWYASADMDEFDIFTRAAAAVSGDSVNSVGEAYSAGADDYYREMLEDTHVHISDDSAPEIDDLKLELAAYVETWDEFPEVIVIDNLLNVQGSEEYQGQSWVMKELHTLARETRATVFVLHHVSEGSHGDSTVPGGRKDIIGKLTQFPEVVLTVALNQGTQDFGVACVKNRNGKADATGRSPVWIRAVPERATFIERPTATYGYGDWND